MSESEQTRVLIERVQSGNSAALDELCARYLARVLTAVRVQLGPHLRQKIESCDIVQDVMIEAVRRIPSFEFKTEGAFLHYLNRVVANKIRDQADVWAAQRRNAQREIPLDAPDVGSSLAPIAGVAGDEGTPSQIVSQGEDMKLLERALDVLGDQSPEYRNLIVAVKLEGRTYEELAEETGKSPDAVRMQVGRAMKALTSIFDRIDRGPSPRHS